MNSIGA